MKGNANGGKCQLGICQRKEMPTEGNANGGYANGRKCQRGICQRVQMSTGEMPKTTGVCSEGAGCALVYFKKQGKRK